MADTSLIERYATRKRQCLERFDEDIEVNSLEEEEYETIVMQTEALGKEAFKTMTNFYPHEFRTLYAKVEHILNGHQRRGRQPTFDPNESFFLVLVVMLHHYPKWHKFAVDWKCKTPNVLKNTVMRTLQLIQEPLVNAYVPIWSKKVQLDRKINFKYFPEASLVVDVTFQPSYRPNARFHEARRYYSGKHHQYGIKTQVAHAPDGRAMFVGQHEPGSVHDYTLFLKDASMYKKFLKKRSNEKGLDDNGLLKDQYDDEWALLADKGYQGASSELRAILPKKGQLTSMNEQHNRNVAHDRIICENFYGRMKMLWSIMQDTFRWDHEHYDCVFQVCVALTNFHLSQSPLRSNDGDLYRRVMASYQREGEKREAQKREWNKKYRDRMKVRAMTQSQTFSTQE